MNQIIEFIKRKKDFILYSGLKILIMILGLLSNIIIVRKLSIDSYGQFSIALVLLGFLTTFGVSWSSSSILYIGGKEKATTGKLNKTFWARNIIIAVSLFFVTFIFIVFNKQIDNYIGISIWYLILIWLYVTVIEGYLNNYFLAVRKQVLSNTLSITAKMIYLVLVLVAHFDVKTLIILNIISHGTVILYILKINKQDISKFEFDSIWFKEVLNFSLWQLLGFSGLYLINFGDTVVIKHYMEFQEVGIYNAAYKIFNTITMLSYVISNFYASSIAEYFSNKKHIELKTFFYKDRFIMLGIILMFHIVIILFSRQIIYLIYGERYIEAITIFKVLMIGSFFRYYYVYYVLYFNNNNKYSVQQTINILRAILNILLDIVFIKCFGLIGPAIATTIAIAVSTIISYIVFEKELRQICYSNTD